ncbi:hypothetical protein [Stenotrophomonas sp. YIM B06876]|uniref:hypothetical protein n=1 Tax=Stenotrophomonas sp. YIM B06876 TaxID=3060211 RepID=UPI0027385EDA|nr:hypothetical protein [Stenotrophomonas sp. YIM B06876]
MNLALHFGLLGSLEAGLIALLLGFSVFYLCQYLCRRAGGSHGLAIACACGVALVLGAGIDVWKLFYLGIVRLESPLYARIALASIHDPDQLGTRVVLELIGGLTGVALGWWAFSSRLAADGASAHKQPPP